MRTALFIILIALVAANASAQTAVCFDPPPQTFTTVLEAVDRATRSGDAQVPADCPQVSCPGGNPTESFLTVEQRAINVTQDSEGRFSFTARLNVTTAEPIPVTVPVAGECGMEVDTQHGDFDTLQLAGNVVFSTVWQTQEGGTVTVNQVSFENLAVTELEDDDVNLTGGFGCQIANLGISFYLEIIRDTIIGRIQDDGIENICRNCRRPFRRECEPFDPNADRQVSIEDVFYLVNYLFFSGPAPQIDPPGGDANFDGTADAADILYVLNHLFAGGPPP